MLDQFDLISIFEDAREPAADIAAADENDALYRLVEAPHLTHHGTDVLLGSDEEDLVVNLDHGITLRDDGRATTKDGRHAGLDSGHVLAQLAQLVADERPAVVRLDRYQAHPPTREINHLQRTRILDQSFHLIDHHLFGAD